MTVRNSIGDIVQICYGADGLDPTYMEGKVNIIFYELFFVFSIENGVYGKIVFMCDCLLLKIF